MLHIKVPATSANIGPGFDTLGLALNLFNEIRISKSTQLSSSIIWHTAESLVSDADNLVVQGIQAAFNYYHSDYIPYTLEMLSCEIPISRGLGSSAAAYVAGIAAGLYLQDKPLDKSLICQIGSLMEGHPDNVAPAVYGGLVTALIHDQKILHQPVSLKTPLSFLALIPNVPLSTEKARAILPRVYERSEVVFNLSRLSLLITALTNGTLEYLKEATQDKVHTPYRLSLMPDSKRLSDISDLKDCLGSYISGAGSTFMVLCSRNALDNCMAQIQTILSDAEYEWQLKPLDLLESGLTWEELL